MSADTRQPEPGTLSQDGQFVWTGADWAPAGGSFGTGWTRPLQRAAAGFFLISVLVSMLNTFVLSRDLHRYYTESLQRSMPSGQAESMAGTAATVTIGFALVLAAIYLVMAWASTRGWSWAFWVDLVLLGFGGLGAFLGLGSLGNSPVALPGAIASEVLNVAALALFIWFLVALSKYGVWARRKAR